MFVPDIRADRNLETKGDSSRCELKFHAGIVVKASDGRAGKISVTKDEHFTFRRRLELDLIARSVDVTKDFRAIMWRGNPALSFAMAWLQKMEDFIEDLPDVNMTPGTIAALHAPGDVVKVSEDFIEVIRRRGQLSSSSRNRGSTHTSIFKSEHENAWMKMKSLERNGTVVDVTPFGHSFVVFEDRTLWVIQSRFLKVVQRWEDCSNGEGVGFHKDVSKTVDDMIVNLLKLKFQQFRRQCLHAACFSGNKDLLDGVLEDDVDVEYEDGNGNKPLHCAARSGVVQVTKTFLLNGSTRH
ncbi:uncharacterized protein LOC144165710 isoform X2 [Haemaphysalis longicornis]